jgi:predicted RNase H-like HicB family nuclease
MSPDTLLTGMLIWQIFCLLILGGVAFLVIRLLIIKNFPRKSALASTHPALDYYSVVIRWHSGHQTFLAEVPDLPGCLANGPTKSAALAASEVAISQWLAAAQAQNRLVPAPR